MKITLDLIILQVIFQISMRSQLAGGEINAPFHSTNKPVHFAFWELFTLDLSKHSKLQPHELSSLLPAGQGAPALVQALAPSPVPPAAAENRDWVLLCCWGTFWHQPEWAEMPVLIFLKIQQIFRKNGKCKNVFGHNTFVMWTPMQKQWNGVIFSGIPAWGKKATLLLQIL